MQDLKEQLKPLVEDMRRLGLRALEIAHNELGKVIADEDFEKAQNLMFVLGRFGEMYSHLVYNLRDNNPFRNGEADNDGNDDDDENESAVVGFDIPPNAHFATTEPSVEYAKPSVDKN